MKLSKKMLFGALGLSALAVTVPIVLTSCSDNSKNIELVKDLSSYGSNELLGVKSYGFSNSTPVNDTYKNKSGEELQNLLGVKASPNIATGDMNSISKENFEKFIDGLTFQSIYEDNIDNPKELLWSNINTSAFDNSNVSNGVTILGGSTVSIAFALNSKDATWNDGSFGTITFVINTMSMS